MVKRLDLALRDGDPIRAVIRGSNVCSDGRTPGITMPSCEIQTRMVQRAYERAGLDPRDTTYVEAHGQFTQLVSPRHVRLTRDAGTGTTAGDAIEAQSLKETFCKGRQDGKKLFIGSVKANVGHTESVAGLAGLIKTVLMLENKVIPRNVTFVKPSSTIPLELWGMEVSRSHLASLTLCPRLT